MQIEYKLVKVTWRDVISNAVGWKTIEKVTSSQPNEVVSVGYLLKADDRTVWIAASLTEDGDCDGDVVIPIDWVTKVEEL